MSNHAQLPRWDSKSDPQKLDTLHKLVMDLYRYQLDETMTKIVALLDNHRPADDKETQDIVTIKTLISQHPNILNMNCEVGHLTASAIVIDITTGRFLLHYHRRLGRWLQFGGHTDYETDLAHVALREAQEECGLPDLAFLPNSHHPIPIDIDVHTIPENGDFPEHLHLDFRYVLTTSQPTILAPEAGESTQFRWLTYDELLMMQDEIDASLLRLIRKTKSRIDTL